jgi:hypothetical protein
VGSDVQGVGMSDTRIVKESTDAALQGETNQRLPDPLALPVGTRVGVYIIEAVWSRS